MTSCLVLCVTLHNRLGNVVGNLNMNMLGLYIDAVMDSAARRKTVIPTIPDDGKCHGN